LETRGKEERFKKGEIPIYREKEIGLHRNVIKMFRNKKWQEKFSKTGEVAYRRITLNVTSGVELRNIDTYV
jgi:hypothetical protein